MELVTKRDMDDARKILDVVANSDDGTLIRDFVHDVAQAIADGRRPEEPRLQEKQTIADAVCFGWRKGRTDSGDMM